MTNEVQTTATQNVIAGLKRGITNVRTAMPTTSNEPIIRFLQDGSWVYGHDNTLSEEKSRWAINPASIQHGFVCWTDYDKDQKKKNELKGEVYAPMSAGPVDPTKLPKHYVVEGDENSGTWAWKPAVSMQLRCTNGEDKGQQVVYKPTSIGGANAVDAVLKELETQLDTGSDAIVPIVELREDSYKHTTYGKTYIPVMKVVDWTTMDGPDAGPEKVEGSAATATPADDAASTETEAEASPPAEAEAPVENEGKTRRRRRTAA